MTLTSITQLDRTEIMLAANLVTASFFDLGVARWLVPDPSERRHPLRGHILLGIQQAFPGGRVDMAGGGAAVAVWRRLPRGPVASPADYEEKLRRVCGEHTDRFLVLDKAFEQHHPHDSEHVVLDFLAVDPERQGQGLGTALLRHQHEQLDQQGLSAFLIASCEASRRLYEREGYDLIQAYPLPNGPMIFAMMRSPRAVPAAG